MPIQFSEQQIQQATHESKLDLSMFNNMTVDEIKKMKVEGKPISAYKIKKYILPHQKLQD